MQFGIAEKWLFTGIFARKCLRIHLVFRSSSKNLLKSFGVMEKLVPKTDFLRIVDEEKRNLQRILSIFLQWGESVLACNMLMNPSRGL